MSARDRERRTRRQRSDGERSRNAILQEAAQLATVEGIDGLSIGRLADAVGMSKSGLFAHFGSKEELQLATIETARRRVHRARDRARAGRPDGPRAAASSSRRASCATSRTTSSPAAASSPRSRPRWTRTPARFATSRCGSSRTGSACSRQPSRDAQAEGAIDPSEDAGAARLRARRLPAARERPVRDQRRVGADRPGAPRDRAPARGSSPRRLIVRPTWRPVTRATYQAAAARPAARPENRQPPRNVPSSAR